jgi:spore coat polysaccharide biosynthesis predicted glycosyltransferase SpsG
VGWGHVSRARALLSLKECEGAIVLGGAFGEVEARFGNSEYCWRPWNAPTPSVSSLDQFDCVIVDDYELPDRWFDLVRRKKMLVVVDDWMRESVRADLVVNPNVGAVTQDYPRMAPRKVLTGSKYALLRPEAISEPRGTGPSLGQVLVTLGGSDPVGFTADLVECLSSTHWFKAGGVLVVVLGPSYSGPEPWRDNPRYERVRVVRDPTDFLELCRASDVVICGASVTSYEMAYLNKPFIPVASVENQRRVAEGWRAAGVPVVGPLFGCEWRRSAEHALSQALDGTGGGRLGRIGGAAVDGRGAIRLLGQLEALG